MFFCLFRLFILPVCLFRLFVYFPVCLFRLFILPVCLFRPFVYFTCLFTFLFVYLARYLFCTFIYFACLFISPVYLFCLFVYFARLFILPVCLSFSFISLVLLIATSQHGQRLSYSVIISLCIFSASVDLLRIKIGQREDKQFILPSPPPRGLVISQLYGSIPAITQCKNVICSQLIRYCNVRPLTRK